MTRQGADARRVAAVLACLALPGTGVLASQDGPGSHQFRDWTFIDAAPVCMIHTAVTSNRTGSLLVDLSFQPARDTGDADALLVAVRVPVGVHLPAGIGLRQPGDGPRAIGLDWARCDRTMCTAVGRVSGAVTERLRRGRSVFVGFQPTATSRPVNIEVSLMGFTRASAALRECAPREPG